MNTRNYEIIIFNCVTGKTLNKSIVHCDNDTVTKTADKLRLRYTLKTNCFCDYIIHGITIGTVFDRKYAISTIYTDTRNYATLRFYKDNEIVFEKTYKTFSAAKKAETIMLKKFY